MGLSFDFGHNLISQLLRKRIEDWMFREVNYLVTLVLTSNLDFQNPFLEIFDNTVKVFFILSFTGFCQFYDIRTFINVRLCQKSHSLLITLRMLRLVTYLWFLPLDVFLSALSNLFYFLGFDFGIPLSQVGFILVVTCH